MTLVAGEVEVVTPQGDQAVGVDLEHTGERTSLAFPRNISCVAAIVAIAKDLLRT